MKWNFKEIFANRGEVALALQNYEQNCSAFARQYEGKISSLSSSEFAVCLEEYANLLNQNAKLCNFSSMLADVTEGMQRLTEYALYINEEAVRIEERADFLYVEVLELAPDEFSSKLEKLSPVAQNYCRNIRLSLGHNVEADTDEAAKRLALFGEYQKLQAGHCYRMDNMDFPEDEFAGLLFSDNQGIRSFAGDAMNDAYRKDAENLAQILQKLAAVRHEYNEAHHFDKPYSESCLFNGISEAVLENFSAETKKQAQKISGRFYELKARLLNQTELSYWSQDARFSAVNGKCYKATEAFGIVLMALGKFVPEFVDICSKLIETDHIDLYPRDKKRLANYCISAGVDVMPYIFLNYTGTLNDVVHLAHELGHGIHQEMLRKQGALGMTSSSIADEIISSFAELLLFDYWCEQQKNGEMKNILQTIMLERQVNVIFYSLGIHEMEVKIHSQGKTGEIDKNFLCLSWKQTMSEYMGAVFHFDGAEYSWGSEVYFFDKPFALYPYAVSMFCAGRLFSLYKSRQLPDFEERYCRMLKFGDSKNWQKNMADFGFDVASPDFWKDGFDSLSAQVEALS